MIHPLQKLCVVLLCSPFIGVGLLALAGGVSGEQTLLDALLCAAYFIVFGALCIGFVWRRMNRCTNRRR